MARGRAGHHVACHAVGTDGTTNWEIRGMTHAPSCFRRAAASPARSAPRPSPPPPPPASRAAADPRGGREAAARGGGSAAARPRAGQDSAGSHRGPHEPDRHHHGRSRRGRPRDHRQGRSRDERRRPRQTASTAIAPRSKQAAAPRLGSWRCRLGQDVAVTDLPIEGGAAARAASSTRAPATPPSASSRRRCATRRPARSAASSPRRSTRQR